MKGNYRQQLHRKLLESADGFSLEDECIKLLRLDAKKVEQVEA